MRSNYKPNNLTIDNFLLQCGFYSAKTPNRTQYYLELANLETPKNQALPQKISSYINFHKDIIITKFINVLRTLAEQNNIVGEWKFRTTRTSHASYLVFEGESHNYGCSTDLVFNSDLQRLFETVFPKEIANLLITNMEPGEEHSHGNYIGFPEITKDNFALNIESWLLQEVNRACKQRAGLASNFIKSNIFSMRDTVQTVQDYLHLELEEEAKQELLETSKGTKRRFMEV